MIGRGNSLGSPVQGRKRGVQAGILTIPDDTLNVYYANGSYFLSLNTEDQTFIGLNVQAGGSDISATVGGTIFDHYIDAGNVLVAETDLYSDTLPANILELAGDKIIASYAGIMKLSPTATRELKVYFAGNKIFDTSTMTISANVSWTITVIIVRISETDVRSICVINTQAGVLVSPAQVSELTGIDLAVDNILKITGQAAGTGAATNDIVATMGTVEWQPAA